jgi:hypothetical protein
MHEKIINLYNFMENWFFHNNDSTDNMNDMHYYFNEQSENDENSYISNSYNNRSTLVQDELNARHEESHSHSNESENPSKTPAIAQAVEVNGENENLNKTIKNDEGSSPSSDKNKENVNNKNMSTKENSNLNEEINIVKEPENSNKKEEVKNKKELIFQIVKTKPSYFKYESAKKHWKTKISQSSILDLNDLIECSDLPNKDEIKIHKPNSLLFSANAKDSDNCIFLEKNLRTIFTIGKEKYANQKNNDINISKIYDYFEKIGYDNLSDKMLEIKNFLEMKYEDYIKKFYESEEFINFKKLKITRFYDEETKKQEGIAISDYLGLIRLFRKKRKRDKLAEDI